MKKFILSLLVVLSTGYCLVAQPGQPKAETGSSIYRETPEQINDLVHTKLDARLDFKNAYLHGKAWLTLKPYFYPTDSLELDAKGMEIRKVEIMKAGKYYPLKYSYDGMMLDIKLDRTYRNNEKYTVYIDYTAKPDEFDAKGSAAITGAKGLYFIDPRGEDPEKPTQVWTQGETEATSVWVPTIDRPNQRTTQELSMTVPSAYSTLSNGLLVSQKKNADGTRTDTWKMDLPHAPYLFFMGVGEYSIVKDKYKGKEVSYYVEKEYAPVARKIFGNTPEMMQFFSRLLGIEYPWSKYAQIVSRDYVSGAMENTTATIHQETAQQDARQLIDGNIWEGTIAHELFHQWFGNLVTTESWSNLTLNESFANYSQVLWDEYKYGKDAGDAENFNDMNGYLQSGSEKKDLVRFNYNDKEDMFDAVSYNKGGRILHMLRNYVGDSAFFKSLNLYLTQNKFKAAEAHHLRLAFEEVTGKDLNWFWNQWYFGAGHPKLEISYDYNGPSQQAIVIVKQTQAGDKIFRLPVAVDIYHGSRKTRHQVWVQNKIDTFYFASSTKPDLINFDGDKVLLAEKKENKTLENYIHQYKVAGKYLDRREAIDAASKKLDDSGALDLIKTAMKDRYHGLRSFAISKVDLRKETVKKEAEPILAEIARNDPKTTVRAAAIAKLGDYNKAEYISLFRSATRDSSYSVAGSALEALGKIDSLGAMAVAKELSARPAKGRLNAAITSTIIRFGDESSAEMIISNFEKMPPSQEKFEAMGPVSQFLAKLKNTSQFKRGVDAIAAFRDAIPGEQFAAYVNNIVLKPLADKATNKEHADYVKGKMEKKGF